MGDAQMLPQHTTEYEQLCDHYRKGFEWAFEVCKIFLLFQAALVAALGIVIAQPTFQKTALIFGIQTRLSLLFISTIGLLSGFGAVGVTRRFVRYYEACIARASEIESMYQMRYMTDFRSVWDRSGFVSGTSIPMAFSILLAVFWSVGILNSFGP